MKSKNSSNLTNYKRIHIREKPFGWDRCEKKVFKFKYFNSS